MSQLDLPLPTDLAQAALELAGAAEEDLPYEVWPRQLADLVDVLVATFMRRGRTHDEAMDEAREAILAMALYMGGHHLYLPNAAKLRAAFLHSRIYHEHMRGARFEQLALDHGVTVRHIERIVGRQVQYRRRRRQSVLFPPI